MIRADLHMHTIFSPDSSISPKTLVEQLVLHPSIKAAAVTDHDCVDGIKTTIQLASAYPDIVIIPGVEITTPKGDILILGTKVLPPKPWDVESIIDFAQDNNCVSIAAHPFRELGLGESAPESGVDAIEVLNGKSSFSANKQAYELAKSAKLPGVAGSDAHNPSELYSVYTQINASLNLDDILAAIKKGLVSVYSSSKSISF
ncbi:MAG: PHP domain-containing protein [Crenarchaeota archaeon]|nr:PHP domain-containing protein [Thermoproteota archaeon]